MTDQVEKGKIKINFCPTDKMVADYMTKPLQGKKFKLFRSLIMNLPLMVVQMMICCSQFGTNDDTNGTDRSVLKINLGQDGRTDECNWRSSLDQENGNATLFEIGSTTAITKVN